MDRASAALILNSTVTGHPEAVLESSIISGCRTAASAALAATKLRGAIAARQLGLLGCGPINFETLRFLLSVRPEVEEIWILDVVAEVAERFADKARRMSGGRAVRIAGSTGELFRQSDIASVATNRTAPFLDTAADFRTGAVILHISLRDFAPEVILAVDNVVDDVEHVCSNNTSLDLAAQMTGHRDFIRTTVGRILEGEPGRSGAAPVIFSPFGLGILDIALGKQTAEWARAAGVGLRLEGFLPTPWTERPYSAAAKGAG